MNAKQRIAILTMVLLVILLLFSCVGRGIPKIVLPDLEDPGVLDMLVGIITGDGEVAASELTDETTPFNLEGEESFSFSITPQEGIAFIVIFRDQEQPSVLVDDVLVYEIDVSTTAAGTYEIIIRATIIPPDQSTPRNNTTTEVRLWIHVVNHPPVKPFNPVPADGAEGQPIEGVVLGWDSSDHEDDPITYMVYWGESEEDLELIATTTLKNHPLEELAYSTQYFWRVDADDGRTSGPRELTQGDVWRFTTQAQMFTLTLNRNNNAWGTVTGGGNYAAGHGVTIQATPNEGFRFVNWTRNGTVVSAQATHAYPMPAEDVTLVANFEAIPTYTLTLTANPENGGVLGGAGTYPAGTQVQITAVENEGFEFVNWTHGSPGGAEVSDQANFTYTMPAEHVTLVANFERVPIMVLVEGGTFRMGDEYNELLPVTRPVHNVELTYDFWIGKYEVTFAEYAAFCDADPERDLPYDEGWGGGDRPVINVSWWDAIAYCNWLSEQKGLAVAYRLQGQENEGSLLDADGNVTDNITLVVGYRLPTEAEWEYAASGGHNATEPRHKYAGSNTIGNVAWYTANSGGETKPVGDLDPNELYLYDMSGNVWEWCHDWYNSNFYDQGDKRNPIGPDTGSDRVLRGGSWHNNIDACRVAHRNYWNPGEKLNNMGFRIARTGETYTLSLEANPVEGGMSPEGDGNYSAGREAKISIYHNEGYSFVNWTKNGDVVSTDAGFTYPMPGQDTTLVANFGRVPEMVQVEGGTFQMGDEHDNLDPNTKPVHEVELTYDFWIGKYEVTFDEYDAFCDDVAGREPPADEGWGRGTRPVINVSWWDAIAYCNWLSVQNVLAPAYDSDGNLLDRDGQITTDITQVEGYRLPTEAEWEYAASGGHRALPIPPRFLYAGSDNIDAVAWYWDNSNADGTVRKTQPVGGKDENELGLHDMSGNVYEWCHDWYGSYTSANKTDPIGPPTGSGRVSRGGSWSGGAQYCRVAYRISFSPDTRVSTFGFRITRTHF